MKVLVDAQLPKRLARLFHRAGHDAIHTLDLPSANRTPDGSLTAIVNNDGRVLVTKDADFVNSYPGVPQARQTPVGVHWQYFQR